MSGQEIWVVRRNHLLKRPDPSLVTTEPSFLRFTTHWVRGPQATHLPERTATIYCPNQGYDSLWIVRNPE